jgi:threonine dehydrogenase-like Zn-dependent dehydrogenase
VSWETLASTTVAVKVLSVLAAEGEGLVRTLATAHWVANLQVQRGGTGEVVSSAGAGTLGVVEVAIALAFDTSGVISSGYNESHCSSLRISVIHSDG